MKSLHKKIALASCLTIFFCTDAQVNAESCPKYTYVVFPSISGESNYRLEVKHSSEITQLRSVEGKDYVDCIYIWKKSDVSFSTWNFNDSSHITITKECKNVFKSHGPWTEGSDGWQRCEGPGCSFICDNASGSKVETSTEHTRKPRRFDFIPTPPTPRP